MLSGVFYAVRRYVVKQVTGSAIHNLVRVWCHRGVRAVGGVSFSGGVGTVLGVITA